MAEIGVAYVTLAISGKGVTTGVMKELSGLNMGTVGTKLGSSLGLSISSGLKSAGASITGVGAKLTSGITKPALTAASALAGISIGAGFKRLVDIDNATAKLSGLGHSAGSVKTIMNDALASVRGTAFGMGEAATTAAGAVAAGIKPGKDLQRTLKLTADAATIAGTGMGEMGAIFNKVATSNKIQGDVIAQLSDAGIPIVQLLGKELGVTGEEVVALASKGKINFAQFQNAMQAGLGGAALKSGETFTGALKNMWAALGRIGANLLSGVFPQIKGIFGDITNGLSGWEDKAKGWGATLGTVFANIVTSIRAVFKWWNNLSAGTQKFIGIAAGIAVALGPALLIIGRILTGIGSMVAVGGRVIGVLTKIGPVFAFIASPIGLIVTAIAAAAAGITLFLTKTQAGQAILAGFQAFVVRAGAAIKGLFTLFATGNFTGGLGQALGIEEDSGLVTFLLGVRDTFITVFGAIKAAMVTVGPALKSTFGQLVTILAPAGAALGAAFGQIGAALAPVLPVIGGAFKQIFAAIGPLIPQLAQLWMQISPVSLIFKVLTPLLPTIATLLGQVAGVVAQVVSAVAPLVAQLVSSLAPIIAQLVSSILPPLIQIFQMVAPIISTVVSAIAPLITQIASLLIPIINALMPVVTTVFGVIASIITSVMQVVQGVIQVVTGIISGDWSMVWTGIQNIFSGIWNTIVNIVTGVFKIIGSVITAGLNIAKTVVSTVLGAIGGFFSTIWNGIVSRVQYAINLVASVIRIVSGAIGSAWNNFWGGFARTVGTIWGGITNSVKSGIDTVVGFVQGLPGQVMGFFSGAGSWLTDAGRHIIEGFLSGIKNAFEGVKNFVGGIGQWIADHKGPKAYDLALLVPAGGWIMTGLQKGIANALPALSSTLGNVSDTIQNGVDANYRSRFDGSTLTSASQGSAAGGGSPISIEINQVDDTIGTAHAVSNRLVALGV